MVDGLISRLARLFFSREINARFRILDTNLKFQNLDETRLDI